MKPEALPQSFALDVQSLDRLKHQAARDPRSGLKAAAQHFEALFIQMMLKSMREATPQSGLLDSQQSRFYEGLMDQQWSQELARRGIGIADQLTAQLAGERKTAVPPPDRVQALGPAADNHYSAPEGLAAPAPAGPQQQEICE